MKPELERAIERTTGLAISTLRAMTLPEMRKHFASRRPNNAITRNSHLLAELASRVEASDREMAERFGSQSSTQGAGDS